MKLTLVGLPLGNIEDISLRAVKTLSSASFIICEDTRVFHRLWQKLINLNLIDHPFQGELAVINDFNEKAKAASVIDRLEEMGEGILVADAGLPAISDPGFVLVNEVLGRNGEIDVVPGPTAAMTALSLSGLSADKVIHWGFLPKKLAKITKLLAELPPAVTVIFYQSPYRLSATLKFLSTTLSSDTPFVITRELTKPHQQILRGSLAEVASRLPASVKGEVVVLFRHQTAY